LKKTFAKKIAAILFLTFLLVGIESFINHSEASAYFEDSLKENNSNGLLESFISTSSSFNQNEEHSMDPEFDLDSEMAKISANFLKEFKYQVETSGKIKEEDYNELLTIIIEGKTIQLKLEIKAIEKDLKRLTLKDKFAFTKKSKKRIDKIIKENLIELEEKRKECFLSEQLLQKAKEKENEENKTKQLEQIINEV
jgi:hypothetical protein